MHLDFDMKLLTHLVPQKAKNLVTNFLRRSKSPERETGLAEEEERAMQLAAQLAAEAAEARRKEAQRIKPMLQAGHHLALLYLFHASNCLNYTYMTLHILCLKSDMKLA